MWNNAVDAEELYLKYFIKNVFDPFFTIRADWKDPNHQNGFSQITQRLPMEDVIILQWAAYTGWTCIGAIQLWN